MMMQGLANFKDRLLLHFKQDASKLATEL